MKLTVEYQDDTTRDYAFDIPDDGKFDTYSGGDGLVHFRVLDSEGNVLDSVVVNVGAVLFHAYRLTDEADVGAEAEARVAA